MPSKTSTIRKRAQDCMKKRNWEGAIGEYRQLADLEQSNPNIYNELGDLYLKVNNKSDALKSYEQAIEAYSRVGLLNNAVAVCKKLLRFQSGNVEIFATLGGLRRKQGFLKEATTYFLAYIEKLVLDVSLEPEAMKERILAVADEMHDSAEILETVAGHLLKWEADDHGIQILEKLLRLYEKTGKNERAEEVKARLRELGVDEETLQSAPAAKMEDNGWTEDKLWTKSPMTEGERITDDKDITDTNIPSASSETPSPAATSNTLRDYGDIELDRPPQRRMDGEEEDRSVAESTAAPLEQTAVSIDEPTEEPRKEEQQSDQQDSEAGETATEDTAAGEEAMSEDKVWIPEDDVPDPLSEGASDNGGKVVHVSQIIDEFKSEIKESVDEEDYRSHYDLGMAYLEMDFHKEAIQEFQFAAKSDSYRVKSLEMIGLCFLNQGKPQLAIKQLRKGLELVGRSDRETLGILYNLGLAYEQIGETDKARNCFEEVYVVDVTFRDVAEKIQQHSS
jgi:tetratricopeptide (TPR) repeat protein